MQHITTTPFGRPMTADLMAARTLARGDARSPAADKWQVIRDLGIARRAFGLTDRDLTVLAALVSFHRAAAVPAAATIVFPSNASLAARAHGMAESTLRRHLAALVGAGLILRHDSPNGKRYAVRGHGVDRAFGFDLSPLARRAAEIAGAVRAAETDAAALRLLRETVILRLRDCERMLALTGAAADETLSDVRRLLRRKPDAAVLAPLLRHLSAYLATLTPPVPDEPEMHEPGTARSGGDDSRNERHIQDSDRSLSDSESRDEPKAAEAAPPESRTAESRIPESPTPEPALPLPLVLRACPDILPYAGAPIRDWRGLIAAAARIAPMMGIAPPLWAEAVAAMGPAPAAITLACMLQGFGRLKNPAGYLRSLARKASAGGFSPGPMVLALIRAENRQAA